LDLVRPARASNNDLHIYMPHSNRNSNSNQTQFKVSNYDAGQATNRRNFVELSTLPMSVKHVKYFNLFHVWNEMPRSYD